MSLQALKDSFPDYAKDIKLNLANILQNEASLSSQQFWGTVVVSAIASKQQHLLATVLQEAQTHLSIDALKAAKSAASLMAMNNIYYRFTHLVSNQDYSSMPAQLRMQTMMNPGIPKIDFELYALAISAINGCGLCMDSHVKQLEKNGVSQETIQHTIRVASIIHSVATVLMIEEPSIH